MIKLTQRLAEFSCMLAFHSFQSEQCSGCLEYKYGIAQSLSSYARLEKVGTLQLWARTGDCGSARIQLLSSSQQFNRESNTMQWYLLVGAAVGLSLFTHWSQHATHQHWDRGSGTAWYGADRPHLAGRISAILPPVNRQGW